MAGDDDDDDVDDDDGVGDGDGEGGGDEGEKMNDTTGRRLELLQKRMEEE